jgi:hypothetical protein
MSRRDHLSKCEVLKMKFWLYSSLERFKSDVGPGQRYRSVLLYVCRTVRDVGERVDSSKRREVGHHGCQEDVLQAIPVLEMCLIPRHSISSMRTSIFLSWTQTGNHRYPPGIACTSRYRSTRFCRKSSFRCCALYRVGTHLILGVCRIPSVCELSKRGIAPKCRFGPSRIIVGWG